MAQLSERQQTGTVPAATSQRGMRDRNSTRSRRCQLRKAAGHAQPEAAMPRPAIKNRNASLPAEPALYRSLTDWNQFYIGLGPDILVEEVLSKTGPRRPTFAWL